MVYEKYNIQKCFYKIIKLFVNCLHIHIIKKFIHYIITVRTDFSE